MSEQHNETQPPMPPPPAPSRWKWALAQAIPGGFVGTHFFGFHGLNQLQRLGYVSAETAGAMVAVVPLVCLGGLPLAACWSPMAFWSLH